MKKMLIVPGLIFILGLAGCAPQAIDETITQPESSSSSTEVTLDVLPAKYTLDEIAGHVVKEDCWMVIDDKVYDVTEYMSHPGGEAIFEGCGLDATELFETRPMGSGTPHSEGARNLMDDFYIGDLEI